MKAEKGGTVQVCTNLDDLYKGFKVVALRPRPGSRFQESFYNTGDIWVRSEKNGCESHSHDNLYPKKKKKKWQIIIW